jgi:acyl carrier protein
MPDEITDRVISALAAAKSIPPDKIRPTSTLEELAIDSLDTISLLYQLEDEFQVSIPDEDARSMRTVGDIVEQIRKLQSKTAKLEATSME